MAGAGTKLWATADTVTATEFQTYLQDQIVAVFATTSARDAAWGGAGEPTLAEGAVAYIKDVNQLHAYASAWVPLLDLDTWAADASGNYTIKGNVTLGVDDTGVDLICYGATASAYMKWDQANDDLVLAGAAGLDIAGDVDIDGTTNLDNVDIDGTVQIDNTVNVGVNDSGWDVKFHGATAGKSWLWDESGDTMFITGGTLLYGDLTVGVDDTGYDVKLFGATSGVYSLWDQSADEWTFVGADIDMDDNAVIRLGTGDDLLVYASGVHSFIDHNGDGDLYIRTLGAGEDIFIDAKDALALKTDSVTRIYIDAATNVGIATTSPHEKLDVHGNIAVNPEITFVPLTDGNAIGYINFHGYHGGATQYRDLGIYNGRQGRMALFDGSENYVIIDGHLGVGSSTPAQKLLVYNGEGWDSGNYLCLIENGDTDSGSGNVLQLKGGATTGDTSSKMLDVLDIGGTTEFFVRGDGVTYLRNASKDAGTFDIPHPVKGGDWRLRHSLVEAPRADLIYRGTTTLSGGTATVDLDTDSDMTAGTWEALNRNPWAMVASSGNAVTWALSGKTLTINSDTADAVCSWMVIGERHDPTIKDSKTRFFDDDGHLIVEAEDASMPGSASYVDDPYPTEPPSEDEAAEEAAA